jgi:quinol monooxygenase YgiN
MSEINIIAILTPAPGKFDRVFPHSQIWAVWSTNAYKAEELFRSIMEEVERNEPGCLRYKIHRSVDGADLVLVETWVLPLLNLSDVGCNGKPAHSIFRYKDQQAFNEHRTTAYFGELQAKMKEEKLVGKPPVHVLCSSIGGFDKRKGDL